jgi:hypothetical protein
MHSKISTPDINRVRLESRSSDINIHCYVINNRQTISQVRSYNFQFCDERLIITSDKSYYFLIQSAFERAGDSNTDYINLCPFDVKELFQYIKKLYPYPKDDKLIPLFYTFYISLFYLLSYNVISLENNQQLLEYIYSIIPSLKNKNKPVELALYWGFALVYSTKNIAHKKDICYFRIKETDEKTIIKIYYVIRKKPVEVIREYATHSFYNLDLHSFNNKIKEDIIYWLNIHESYTVIVKSNNQNEQVDKEKVVLSNYHTSGDFFYTRFLEIKTVSGAHSYSICSIPSFVCY